MEERKEEGEAEIQEHGPEHWFSKWERQCLAEAEQDEQLPPELQDEAAAGAQPEHKQQKLWHLFQNSATAVAQLYKGEGRCRHLAAASARPPGRGPQAASRPGQAGPAAAPLPPPHKMAARRPGRGGARGRPGPARGRPVLGAGPEEPARLLLRPGCRGAPGRGGQGRSPQSQNGEGRRLGRPYCARSRPRGGDRAPPCARGWASGCAPDPEALLPLPPRPLFLPSSQSLWAPETLEQNGET